MKGWAVWSLFGSESKCAHGHRILDGQCFVFWFQIEEVLNVWTLRSVLGDQKCRQAQEKEGYISRLSLVTFFFIMDEPGFSHLHWVLARSQKWHQVHWKWMDRVSPVGCFNSSAGRILDSCHHCTVWLHAILACLWMLWRTGTCLLRHDLIQS